MYILSACISLILINETKLIKKNKLKVLLYVLIVLSTLIGLVFEFFGNITIVNIFFIAFSLIVDFSHISYFLFAPIEEVDEYMLKHKSFYKGLIFFGIISFYSDITQLSSGFNINNLDMFLRRLSFLITVPLYFLRRSILEKKTQ